jgi:hypothetical protein
MGQVKIQLMVAKSIFFSIILSNVKRLLATIFLRKFRYAQPTAGINELSKFPVHVQYAA